MIAADAKSFKCRVKSPPKIRRVLRFAALCGLLAASCAVAQPNALPAAMREALRDGGIPPSSVAAVVQELGGRRILLSVNAASAMNPASVMKLVTTYAALELLGPAFRWRTEVYLDGSLRGDVLDGNLVLKGGGDPKLDQERFWMLLRSLRGKGLREIRGDLVLDRSYFAEPRGDPGAFDGEALRPYNVLPDALLVNFNALRFGFVPEPSGGGVRVFADPRPPGLELVNTLRLAEGPCIEGRAFRALIGASFDGGQPPRAAFTGRYPASCGERELSVALLNPREQVAGIMRQLWAEIGGTWSGAVRDGAAPAGVEPFHVHESAPLAEIVRDTNKFSINVMARQMFLTIAAELTGAPAQPEAAQRVIRQLLAVKGVDAPELVLENGSGLSRVERISAASLVALLNAAWQSAVMPEFMASLPIVSVDGTMRRRLRGDPVAGRAHIKSGLLSDSAAVAGYVLDRSGRRLAVAAIINHPNAPNAQSALEALLRWAYER